MKILNRVENNKLTEDIYQRFSKVEPATIGHHLHYGFMDTRIKSMLQDVSVVGTAFTVRTSVNDSTMVHKAVSLAEEGDFLVIDRTGDVKHACVGEIVAYAANARKLAGIIIDGPCTDIQALREIGIPVFATGLSPITTKLYGQSGEINTVIQCGGVTVSPGDLIVADDNGVLVIPQDLDYEEILKKTEASEQSEPNTKKLLDEGQVLSSITRADKLIEEYESKFGSVVK
ncbi:RraA family protein [Sporosarcina sp. CAU 1771]